MQASNRNTTAEPGETMATFNRIATRAFAPLRATAVFGLATISTGCTSATAIDLEEVGEVVLTLNEVPHDVGCVRVDVRGTRVS